MQLRGADILVGFTQLRPVSPLVHRFPRFVCTAIKGIARHDQRFDHNRTALKARRWRDSIGWANRLARKSRAFLIEHAARQEHRFE